MSTIKMTPALNAALIRVRDAENELDAAWAAIPVKQDGSTKTLRIDNTLRQRHEYAVDERNEATDALIAILRKPA